MNNHEYIKSLNPNQMAYYFLTKYKEVENFKGRFSGLADFVKWLQQEVNNE